MTTAAASAPAPNAALFRLAFAIFALLGWALWPETSSASVAVEEVRGKSGVTALLARDSGLPLISISFAFKGGVEQDDPDKQGLSALAASLLTEGAGPYGAEEFQRRLAQASISMGFSAGRDAVLGNLKTLRDKRGEAFRLLKLALKSPRFDPEAVERVRDSQMAAMRSAFGDPEWQARNALYSATFGGHPYALRRLGTTKTLPSITREDLRRFAATRLFRDNLVIAAAGDISREELADMIDDVFGHLPPRAALKPIPPLVWPDKPPVVLVERDGTQTEMLFALPMPRREDPLWPAAEVANYILGGGGFSSRLMRAARDDAGLTYGIGTALADMDAGSLLIGNVAVANAETGNMKGILMRVWERLRYDSSDEAEIKAAKDYLSGALPLSLTSTHALAGFLVGCRLRGEGKDCLSRRVDLTQAVTTEEVRSVLREWFDPSRLAMAMAGRPEGVAADIVRKQEVE